MVEDGVVRSYAIGGAVGAAFYLEVQSTEDVDVFVVLSNENSLGLDAFAPVFQYFVGRGATFDGMYVVIGSWPVQILPAPSKLHQEAVDLARELRVGDQPVRVMAPEYLALIALELGRLKDKSRLIEFLKLDSFDRDSFEACVVRFGLTEKWASFQSQYLSRAEP